MDMADEDLTIDLDSFLCEWRRELSRDPRRLLGKSTRDSEEESAEAPARKRAALYSTASNDPPPLLVLPADGGRARSIRASAALRGEEVGGRGSRSLVDTLIADLDEINTIPFFDVRLPREVALVIFSHLGVQDLGRCSLVSRSWRSLAEDNILWCRVYHSLGLNTDLSVWQCVCWKVLVRDCVLQRRQVERNWKERVCGLSDHQPDNAGVLCAVDICQQCVLACYSSGAVYTWDICDECGPVRLHHPPFPLPSTSLIPPPLPTCCALTAGWAAVGTEQGHLKLFDVDTNSQVFSLSGLGTLSSVSLDSRHHVTALAAAHHHYADTHSEITVMVVGGGEGEGERRRLPIESKVSRVSLVPSSCDTHCPYAVLYSTPTTLTLQHLSPSLPSPTHFLTSAGPQGATCISCYDLTPELVACGSTAFGYQVQLFDLPSGVFRSALHGHCLEVSCINVSSSPPNKVVTGSADKQVRVFDCSSPRPVQVLAGHRGQVCSVQMDGWKVVSGSLDGTVIVWDQRMGGELWRTHERHPVELCQFSSSHLVAAHLPLDKRPLVETGSPFICHRRQRGLIRVFDFSVDPLYYTKMLPSICSSTYNEPSRSFYNLDLKCPYDAIT